MTELFWKRVMQVTDKEVLLFIVAVVTSGFILSFRRWGAPEFDLIVGLVNFGVFTLYFTVLFIIFIFVQRFIATLYGYKAYFTLWKFGPVVGVLITFMTYGWIPFLYLGNTMLEPIKNLRIGRYRREIQFKELMIVGVSGPLALFAVVLLILEPLYFILELPFLIDLILVSSIIIFFTSLPLPHTNAMNILLYSRAIWLSLVIFGLINIMLILTLSIFYYVISLMMTLTFILFFKYYSKDFF